MIEQSLDSSIVSDKNQEDQDNDKKIFNSPDSKKTNINSEKINLSKNQVSPTSPKKILRPGTIFLKSELEMEK